MVQLSFGSLSITGNFRDNNEDKCLVDPDERFFIVADGMGGQSAGEKASEMATDLVSEKLDALIDFENEKPEDVIEKIDEAVTHANGEILALGEIEPEFHKMGTTISMIVSIGGKFLVGGVGDSRTYRLRDDDFEQLTTDHSLTQALVDAGTIKAEDAPTHRYKNVLYRYLGSKEGANGTDAKIIEPLPGDRFVICSDGVTDGLEDGDLSALVREHDDPQTAAEKIVEGAQEGGSKDNITCVIIHVS